MTKGVAEAVGREKGRGKGRVGRGLRECLRQTIQVKDEMLAPLYESSVFMAWRLTIRNRTWGFGSEGLGSRGLEIGDWIEIWRLEDFWDLPYYPSAHHSQQRQCHPF